MTTGAGAGTRTRIAVTGATGLLGSTLAGVLEREGAHVVRIGRGHGADIEWSALAAEPALLARAGTLDAVVHLSGAPIAVRWTKARVRAIRESRVELTRVLASALAGLEQRPRVLVSASAVGFYGDRGDEVLTEESARGTGWLCDLAQEWEAAARPAEEAGVRVAHLRTGIVLTRRGGALGKMLLPFRLGLGGPLGTGAQWMSWVGLGDWLRAVRFLMDDGATRRGPFNIVAPNPVTNAEFSRALGRALRRPAVLPVPAFALAAVFGEMARHTVLASQRALPARLLAEGFTFETPELPAALRSALQRG